MVLMSWKGIHERLDRSENVNVDGMVGRDLSYASQAGRAEEQGRCSECHALQIQQGQMPKWPGFNAKK